MPAPPYAPQLNHLTGDWVFDQAHSRVAAAASPEAASFALEAATPLGTAARDPAYGLDLEGLENAVDNAPEVFKRALLRLAQKRVDRGEFRATPAPTAVVEALGDALLWRVEFHTARGARSFAEGKS